MKPRALTFSDSELAVGVAGGDAAAESSLYEKYSERVLYLALSERHSREDAEDIRAETFLRVLQALREGKLRKPDSLPSFIVGIALNVMREHRRQRAGTDALTDREEEIAGGESPEAAFLDQEAARSIAEMAARLKPREQQFLRMYYYEELPKEEIARALGVREERLRLIKSRALKSFRAIYEKLKRG
ncbi:MAG TPA: sigma-70 family RNA polymerase sigma factor [Pyrinomonadaceae bacterium]|nr:sigma-70 family RNA polymerase sigma factor [Pyrinomonadaceae bacterium]